MAPPGNRYFRFVLRKDLTPARAGWAIAIATLAVTLVCALVMRIVDASEFGNIWLSLWWAVQTVTTVGYGDVVPVHVSGRAVASVLMLTGIGFVSVVTAAITAAFLETVRRRMGDPAAQELHDKLDELGARLDAIEAALRR